MAADGLLTSLGEKFYFQGKTYSRAEIEALIAAALSSNPATTEGAIFKVRNTDPNYSQVGNNAVVTDIRLLGLSDYPVSASHYGGDDIPDAELTYDSTLGSVTISNCILPNNEYLVISALGAVPASGFNTVLSRLAAVEALTAPDALGAIKIWPFKDDEVPIPTGWVEFIRWSGRVLIPQKPGDDNFDAVRDIGGANEQTLSINQLPAHNFHLFGAEVGTANGSIPTGTDPVPRARNNNDSDSSSNLNYEMTKGTAEPTLGRTNTIGEGDAFDTLPEFVTIRLIIKVGVTVPS